MSTYPVFPLFTDAFISDTTDLTAAETGAYIMLLMVAWRSPDCALPDDDTSLARWARVSRSGWPSIKTRIMRFWTLNEDGFWTQARLTKERERVDKKSRANRENGCRGGRPKSLKEQDTTNPMGKPTESEKNLSISISNKPYSPLRDTSALKEAFERFKQAYPRRDGSQDWKKAEARFASLAAKGAVPERIIAAADGYRQEVERKGNIRTTFVKQAATFLSGAWEEYGSAAVAEPGDDPQPAAWPRNLPAPSLVKSTWLTGKWPRDAWGAEPGEQGSRVPVEIAAEWTAERVAGGEGAALTSGLRLVGAAEFPAKATSALITSAHKIPRAVC